MTESQFSANLQALLTKLTPRLLDEALRLYRSGAVDTEAYGNDYVLPRLILTVAIDNVASYYSPKATAALAEMRNLRRF